MIHGIGVDTVELSRVEYALANPRFGERVFAPEELALPLSSIAARFAAREAAVKALRGLHGLTLRDLAVHRNHLQAPEFSRNAKLDAVLTSLGIKRLHLSLSHDRDYATAFVVAEGHDR
ncbi:holo-ACP synthase [Gulosibacter molinativorax]|uniref:Holo-[acyl-carrier-protein] synthase n=1 Tax=Gulosibacter molinativorax TaxID=256821 RepID=A0ABT7C478_9MICO|nr:holo-ACP synthase [Gulosibacter molinativorax]MDJ1370028.1 holo-[acyl-carrier-protein] synthase [Gulosibacter molinativorax]QUY63782.1 Holo-[acyl-carrier-protein] synthase [Gulosibacter molinativorax]